MKRILGFTFAIIGAAMLVVAIAQAGTSSRSHRQSAGVLVSVRKTALGSILVDARGRTLYLFEKDRNGLSMCSSACTAYWPPLTSHGVPSAGSGIRKTLLALGKAHNGVRQVVYAGHPLYTFVGDKRAGQTSGEGLTNFGAGWYAIAATGQKVDKSDGTSSSTSGSAGSYGSGSGW
jgi:predicted lipoprotein with Yx(FWY)xxD motif